jgi:hypothetical protein
MDYQLGPIGKQIDERLFAVWAVKDIRLFHPLPRQLTPLPAQFVPHAREFLFLREKRFPRSDPLIVRNHKMIPAYVVLCHGAPSLLLATSVCRIRAIRTFIAATRLILIDDLRTSHRSPNVVLDDLLDDGEPSR